MDDIKQFRRALGSFMTGVTVVTATDPQRGVPLGFTANSFTSVSLEPPLLSVCLGNMANLYSVFESCESFAVNILSAEQRLLSNRFASPIDDRFEGVDWFKGYDDVPILQDVSAWFACRSFQKISAGDHMILIGEVQKFEAFDKPGLGFVRGSYFTEDSTQAALDLTSGEAPIQAGAIVDYMGGLLMFEEEDGLSLPHSTPAREASVAMDGLRHLLHDLGISDELGWLYSVEQKRGNQIQSMYFHISIGELPAELPKGYRIVPMKDISVDQVRGFQRGVIERYLNEHERGRFGVYFGDEAQGRISRPKSLNIA